MSLAETTEDGAGTSELGLPVRSARWSACARTSTPEEMLKDSWKDDPV
jgi:hypothetical protein